MKVPIRSLSMLWPLVFLVGCVTTSPDSQNSLPQVQKHVPDTWSQPVVSGDLSSGWLADFDDPALVQLIETAFEQNPSLQAALFPLPAGRSQRTDSRSGSLSHLGSRLFWK